MIEQNEIFNEVKDNIGLWCGAECVGADLAAATGMAISNKLHNISVLPNIVSQIWPWIENTNIRIITRFVIDCDINDNFVSDFSSMVSTCFCSGADGAVLFVRMHDLGRFISELAYVRDDLFFNKFLSIGLDINEIDYDDWENVFNMLKLVRADSLTLTLSRDDGDKSDFVGRIYAMLNTDMGDWHGGLHFMLGQNTARIDQVYRLTGQLRPTFVPKMLFWVNN